MGQQSIPKTVKARKPVGAETGEGKMKIENQELRDEPTTRR